MLNKSKLATYFTDYLEQEKGRLSNNQAIYISRGRDLLNFLHPCIISLALTMRKQKFVFHSVVAANNGDTKVVVCCLDTDVLVLLLYHRCNIKVDSIFLKTGKQAKYVISTSSCST